MSEMGWIFGALGFGLALATNLRIWWRDRRSDGVAEGKAGAEMRADLLKHLGEIREVLARIDERLRRAEEDITHAVRADLLGPHLSALEARMRTETGELRAELRARRPRED